MRVVTLGLGLVLCGLWMVGIDRQATAWLAWFDFLVALAAVFEGVLPAGPTRVLRGTDVVWGAALIAAAAAGYAFDATPWLRAGNALLGVAFLAVAFTPTFRREIERMRQAHEHGNRPSHA